MTLPTEAMAPTMENEFALAVPLPAELNPAIVYLAALTKSGRSSQAQVLRVISGWLGGSVDTINWSALRYQHAAALRSKALEAGYAPASVRKFLAAIRGVLKHAWRLGQITAEDYERARDLDPVVGHTLPAGRKIEKAEIDAMMIVSLRDRSPAGARDAAILASMYFGALRRDEVANLDMADYDQSTGRLVVNGKRSKQRAVYLQNGAQEAMADWLTERGSAPGALFLAIRKHGGVRVRDRVTAQAVYNMITKRAGQVAIKDISPHDFRRTSISDMLDAGIDLVTVQTIAGHDNPKTTAGYDRRPEETRKVAAGMLQIYHEARVKPEDQPPPVKSRYADL